MSNSFRSLPRPAGEPYLRYMSLGGLGEVGMNCALFESEGRRIMVDCGVTFPESMHYGIDLIVPDFSPLHEIADSIEALVVTHGHMDHIGAIPYLLEEFDIPVYAPRFATELIRRMLDERGLHDAKIHVYDEESSETIGPFEIEFPPVNHSIPDAHALAIRCKAGLFVHTGDFKIDHNPVGEEPFDIARFTHLGDEGVRALFADSTNAEVPGACRSEREARRALRQVIVDLPGRIFVALFSSNVFRMKSLLDIAAETGRQVVALGRSVDVALQAALRIGAIELPPGVRILSPDEAKQHSDDELLFICTGTQAEPRAALTRLANRDHPRLALKSNDTVIYSARIIPGNEQWVHRVLDELAKQQVRVITPDDAPVHASGHGYREDIRWMIRMIEPQTLVPVHGDYRYQRANAELGRECGIEEQVVLQNGEVVEFTDSGTEVIGLLETGRRVIDGTVFDDIDGNAFRERRQIARAGLVFVNVVADAKGELSRAPDIIPVGAFAQDAGDGGQMVDDLRRTVERAWKRISKEDRRNEESAAEALRILVRRHLRGELDRKPIVIARVYVAG